MHTFLELSPKAVAFGAPSEVADEGWESSFSPDPCAALLSAASTAQLATLRELAIKGVWLDTPLDPAGRRAIHAAAAAGQTEAVQELLRLGADGDARLRDGRTALHLAAAAGWAEVVQELAAAGVDVNARDQEGAAPLHHAALAGQLSTVQLLVAVGADREARTLGQGRLPMHAASSRGHAAVMQALGTDPNQPDSEGTFGLHMFLSWVARECIPAAPQLLSELMNIGVSVAVASQHWPTPLASLLCLDCEPQRLALVMAAAATPSGDAATMTENAQLYLPELIRVLVDAGCPVDRFPRQHGLGCYPSAVLGWLEWQASTAHTRRQQQQQQCLSQQILDVGTLLLRCAAVECPKGRPALLSTAAMSGSEELVRAVLTVFPEGPGRWDCHRAWCNPICQAAGWLAEALRRLPVPQEGSWDQAAVLFLHFQRLVGILQRAGCPPANIVLGGQPRPVCVSQLGLSSRSYKMLVLPKWAQEPLRCLPLMTADVKWSPHSHADFPPAFRQAAKELLLINGVHGFGAPHIGPPHHFAANAVEHSAQPAGAQLPEDVLLLILQLAAEPLGMWVPQLRCAFA